VPHRFPRLAEYLPHGWRHTNGKVRGRNRGTPVARNHSSDLSRHHIYFAKKRQAWIDGQFGHRVILNRQSNPLRHHPMGKHRLNYSKSLGDKKSWVLKPESEWSFVEVEPMVSGDLWNRVSAMLTERRTSRNPPAKKAKRLFAGVVVCHCGKKMYVPSNTPKYVCYGCRNKIPMTDLEQVFQAQLRIAAMSPAGVRGASAPQSSRGAKKVNRSATGSRASPPSEDCRSWHRRRRTPV
jgi:hypothetical protein